MGNTEDSDMQAVPRPRFDATFNWGHVLIVVTFLVTAAGQWYMTDYRLKLVEDSVKGLSGIVVTQARTDERLIQHEWRLNRLETLAPPRSQ